MSLAIPAFTDLTKAARTVLYGDVAGDGAFAPGVTQVKANTVTADGVILNIKAAVSQSGVVVPSLTTIYSPSTNLMLMGIFGAGGSVTGSATLSNLFRVPGLQATITSTPPVLSQPPAQSVTVDYVTPSARLRAVATPVDPAKPFSAPPKAELSATTSAGPCVLGAKVAADGASGKLSQWSLGATYTRMVAEEGGKGVVGGLSGQQVGVVVTDNAPGSSSSSSSAAARTATLSFHQLLHGGETSLAAEYSLPLAPPGNTPDHSYALSLGAACRLDRDGNTPDHSYALSLGAARRLDSGGLLKARVDQSGLLSLLYQQAVPGMGQLALSCGLDALNVNKVAPSVGFSLNVA
ncbi:hypothetical protein OEZ85_012301 [Tetradesmus obliquus]|uniref:Uncharacterized protein n=1 Tax=Tetradesmus obliquus TaxID=3088 RepID=A0ABY8TSZ7_TETOB|nr:hypothetical protein OEZ85_012301 [Tetradesmus obliquus]